MICIKCHRLEWRYERRDCICDPCRALMAAREELKREELEQKLQALRQNAK